MDVEIIKGLREKEKVISPSTLMISASKIFAGSVSPLAIRNRMERRASQEGRSRPKALLGSNSHGEIIKGHKDVEIIWFKGWDRRRANSHGLGEGEGDLLLGRRPSWAMDVDHLSVPNLRWFCFAARDP